MESTLSGLRGVKSVHARLIRDGLGEAEVFYDSKTITLESLKKAVISASGEKHHFRVISTQE